MDSESPPINWPSSRFISPEITNLIRAFYYSSYRLRLSRAIERPLRFIHPGNKIIAFLEILYHSHWTTRLAMKYSWIQATISARVMTRIATQKLNYLSKYALEIGTKFRSKLEHLKSSKNSKLDLSLRFSQTRELWVRHLELIFQAYGAHSVFKIQIANQKLRYLSKNALAKTGIIFRLELNRLAPLKYSKLSLPFFRAKELRVYCSDLVFRVLALCGVHSVIRSWRYWICILISISLGITCWGLVFAEQEFDREVLPRRTRRLIIQHHSG